ncbi:MAG TPA: PEGA domain-containing protein [Vicinamibacterales bacterium]
MNTGHDLLLDQFSSEGGPDKRLTTWYAQGQSDGFGDRLLMFDNTNAPSWEILRFKPILAREARFDAALRERVEQLTSFQHDAFPLVRPIKRLGHEDGLAVVSTYSGGAPLAEALKKPRSAEFALRLIRQLVPALAALQRVGPGVAHGAVTVDRIILSADGRLMIREHMVGLALDSLEWPPARLWAEFGIIVPRSTARIDERTDITQLGLVVLSLMAGRRIGPDEYPDRLGALLDELTLKNHLQNPSNPGKFQALRHWLERALQLSGQSFMSASEAEAALVDLQEPGESRGTQAEQAFRPAPKPAIAEEPAPMWSAARGLPAPVTPVAALTPTPPAPQPKRASNRTRFAGAIRPQITSVRARVVQVWRSVPGPVMRVASVILAILAIAEAIFIGRLLETRSATTGAATAPVMSSASAGSTLQGATSPAVNESSAAPADAKPVERPASVASLPLVVATATVDPKVPPIKTLPPPPPAVRTGGIRLSTPIELTVLDGDRVVGSSAEGPIFAAAGQHEFEFVNSAIGYRTRQLVEIKAGQVVSFTVPVPNGTLNINAEPWAAVSLNGNPVGETPLGNLSVVPGQYDVVFSHPQLGERRQRVLVRSGVETRVGVNLQK